MKKWGCTTVLAFFMILSGVNSQTILATEYQVKAVFLYNFTHFIDWPPTAFEFTYSPFIIGIIGKDPFGRILDAVIEEERIGTHQIRIQRYKSVSEIGNCHILYVGSQDPDEVREIIEAVSERYILTVGDTPNFIRWGGMIRFYTEEGRIRLQINNTVAKNARLKISSKLLRLSEVL